MHFFRDCGVSAVLESSYHLYTAVLHAVLPCTHETITIFKGRWHHAQLGGMPRPLKHKAVELRPRIQRVDFYLVIKILN